MGKIEHSRTQTLLILKDGIKGFVERNLKKQHHELLKEVSKTANDRGIFSCSECTKENLLTTHSKDSCPSKKECLCKKKSKDLRPCPNGICDKVYERIIMLHATYSPNIKNTNITRWCEDYMELAKCFMRHNPESTAKTDLMDFLHIMANNTPIRKKLGLFGYNGWEHGEDFLNEV
jgi:hypothetical protein